MTDCALRFCYQKIIKGKVKYMDIKDYLLDLYEIELHKKSIYADGFVSDKAKEGKELEFAITVKNITILEKILDSIG